jgi:hypothetical protein
MDKVLRFGRSDGGSTPSGDTKKEGGDEGSIPCLPVGRLPGAHFDYAQCKHFDSLRSLSANNLINMNLKK